MSHEAVIQSLRAGRLLSGKEVRVTSLAGGVSSELLLLEDGSRQVVVKRALPKLKVHDEWRADTSRNLVEQRFIRYAGEHLPQHLLPILLAQPEEGFFVMEFLGAGFTTWKQELLAGRFDSNVARTAAQVLA